MKVLRVPSHEEIFGQAGALLSGNGLAIVAGSNQNRTSWASVEILNVILSKCPYGGERRGVFTIGERDQYTDDDHIEGVEIHDVAPSMVIYAGAIRSTEKAELVLAAAEICPVVAVMHTLDLVQRFEEMGCDAEKVRAALKVVYEMAT